VIYYEYITGIYYVPSLNNSRFGDFLHRIYPYEIEVKDTTDTQKSAYSLTFTLKSTAEEDLKKIYDKRDDFTFPIVNVPFISSNISASPAYGDYISQLIRYFRACAQCSDILELRC
jgi:hypothetical protein